MEIMHEMVSCFLKLKKSGVNIEHALDIGAYRGEFTRALKSVWPNVVVQQFDADERQAEYLQDDAVIAILLDEEREVDLYTIPDTGWGSTTGTSVLLEKTTAYSNPIVKKSMSNTLDSFVDLSADWSKGLVKLDTQGSELMILSGAKELMKLKPAYVLLEVSIREYNVGAPKMIDVINYMAERGYAVSDILDRTYIEGKLFQANILFETEH